MDSQLQKEIVVRNVPLSLRTIFLVFVKGENMFLFCEKNDNESTGCYFIFGPYCPNQCFC